MRGNYWLFNDSATCWYYDDILGIQTGNGWKDKKKTPSTNKRVPGLFYIFGVICCQKKI